MTTRAVDDRDGATDSSESRVAFLRRHPSVSPLAAHGPSLVVDGRAMTCYTVVASSSSSMYPTV